MEQKKQKKTISLPKFDRKSTKRFLSSLAKYCEIDYDFLVDLILGQFAYNIELITVTKTLDYSKTLELFLQGVSQLDFKALAAEIEQVMSKGVENAKFNG